MNDIYHYDHMIQVAPNFIKEEDLKVLNSFYSKVPVTSLKDVAYVEPIYGGQSTEYKTIIDDKEVIEIMYKYERLSMLEAAKRFIFDRGLDIKDYRGHSGYELIRWQVDAALGEHADGPDTPPDWPFLDIGCLMYLNDEYLGGEIRFPDYNITIKPKKGTCVFFPCHFKHEVLKVLENPNGPTRRHTMPMFHWFELEHRKVSFGLRELLAENDSLSVVDLIKKTKLN